MPDQSRRPAPSRWSQWVAEESANPRLPMPWVLARPLPAVPMPLGHIRHGHDGGAHPGR